MSDMADVLRAHQDWTDDYGYKCSCRWQSYTEDAQTHQAAALSTAGFGPVEAARAEAWDEGFSAGWDEAKDPGAFVNNVWDATTPNPYREAS